MDQQVIEQHVQALFELMLTLPPSRATKAMAKCGESELQGAWYDLCNRGLQKKYFKDHNITDLNDIRAINTELRHRIGL